MKTQIESSRMKEKDMESVSEIASGCFSGMKDKENARKWIKCNFNAFPRMQYFVAQIGGEVVGYILWMEKGGFRDKSVWELEQIAVKKDFQGKGIGKELIKKSLSEIRECLKKRNSSLKLIEVTTGADNKAQKIYKDVLDARVECIIKDLFRGNETLMIARCDTQTI